MTTGIGDCDWEVGLVETPEERSAVFSIRLLVFVEEQHVPVEEELDAYDVTATHFLVRARRAGDPHSGTILGTARLIDKGKGIGKIGRVAVDAQYRGLGLGAALMQGIHRYARARGFCRIELEAQCHAIPFYEKLGYSAYGDIFLDANIEHRRMTLQLEPWCDPTAEAAPCNDRYRATEEIL